MDKHGKKFQLNLKRQIVTNLCEFFSCVCIVLVCPGAQRFPEFHELVSILFFNIFSFSLFLYVCIYTWSAYFRMLRKTPPAPVTLFFLPSFIFFCL